MSSFVVRLINFVKLKISISISSLMIIGKLLYKHVKYGRVFIFIATPIYGNLGDHAIIKAQIELVKACGIGERIVEISNTEYTKLKKILKILIKNKDVIAIDGGGNMGTLWLHEEYKMREIVQTYANNPIIIFPQTAFFDSDKEGKSELNKSVAVYNTHRNLRIFCRDASTYNLIKGKMPNVKSFYVPDIVLYLENVNKERMRKGICLILRDDLEKVNSQDVILDTISKYTNEQIFLSTTMSEMKINKNNRDVILQEKWDEFSKYKLIVTDRLHGMLFAAITGTPCIALDNKSHKVAQGYFWIKELPYIVYCDNAEKILDCIEKIQSIWNKKNTYSRDVRERYYNIMKKEILNAIQD